MIGFTASVLKYIEVIKRETGLGIALYFKASSVMDYYEDPPFPC